MDLDVGCLPLSVTLAKPGKILIKAQALIKAICYVTRPFSEQRQANGNSGVMQRTSEWLDRHDEMLRPSKS